MTYLSGPAVNTLLLSTVTPSVSTAEVPVTVILPKALSMTLVTRTCNKMHGQSSYHQHLHLTLGTLFIQLFFFSRNLHTESKGSGLHVSYMYLQNLSHINRTCLQMNVSSLQTTLVALQTIRYTFQALFWEMEASLAKYTCSQMPVLVRALIVLTCDLYCLTINCHARQ